MIDDDGSVWRWESLRNCPIVWRVHGDGSVSAIAIDRFRCFRGCRLTQMSVFAHTISADCRPEVTSWTRAREHHSPSGGCCERAAHEIITRSQINIIRADRLYRKKAQIEARESKRDHSKFHKKGNNDRRTRANGTDVDTRRNKERETKKNLVNFH